MPNTASPQNTIFDCIVPIQGPETNTEFSIERFGLNVSNQEYLPDLLGKLLLSSYRSKKLLREQYRQQDQELLIKYLEDYVFPTDREGRTHSKPETSVRSGDFAEVILNKIAIEKHGLTVPFEKMMWKMRNDRSSFCTDIFAHNIGQIRDLHYYEVKLRQALRKESSKRRNGNFFVSVIAHDSLARDQDVPSEQIADILRRKYFENSEVFEASGDFQKSAENRNLSVEYGKIVDNQNQYARHFCVGLVLDSDKAYSNEIIKDLEELPPELKPLKVTLVLLPDIQNLIVSSFKCAFAEAKDYVFGALS